MFDFSGTAKLYILLPVHNRKKITYEFVRCLKAQSFTDYHLVLIDDGSRDETAKMVLEHLPSATVLQGNGHWWWAGSLQQGLNWLANQRIDDETLILFINDDVEFDPDYLANAVRVMANKKQTLVLSQRKSIDNNDPVETGVEANLRTHEFTLASSQDQINCLSTRGLFLHWSDIRIIGGFHPLLLPHYWSDYEYTIRAHHKGLKCETSSDLLIKFRGEAGNARNTVDARSFSEFLTKYFSKRFLGNPIYASSFVLCTSKPAWIPRNLARVWMQAFKTIATALFKSEKLFS